MDAKETLSIVSDLKFIRFDKVKRILNIYLNFSISSLEHGNVPKVDNDYEDNVLLLKTKE